jgi:hypothetical protein
MRCCDRRRAWAYPAAVAACVVFVGLPMERADKRVSGSHASPRAAAKPSPPIVVTHVVHGNLADTLPLGRLLGSGGTGNDTSHDMPDWPKGLAD